MKARLVPLMSRHESEGGRPRTGAKPKTIARAQAQARWRQRPENKARRAVYIKAWKQRPGNAEKVRAWRRKWDAENALQLRVYRRLWAKRKRAGGPGYPKGERVGSAKLDAQRVSEIRQRFAHGGTSMAFLAGVYGVSRSTVRKLIRRESWVHLA